MCETLFPGSRRRFNHHSTRFTSRIQPSSLLFTFSRSAKAESSFVKLNCLALQVNVVPYVPGTLFRGGRKHGYRLPEIARATEEVCGISLGQLREKGRGEGSGRGRRVMSVVAKEYGYKGQEIAGYLWRDPSVITRYLKEGSKLASEVENVHAILPQDSNKQV